MCSIVANTTYNYSFVLAFGGKIVALTLIHKVGVHELCTWRVTLRVYEQKRLLLSGIWDV